MKRKFERCKEATPEWSEMVGLNVWGQKAVVSRRTLERVGESGLGQVFSEENMGLVGRDEEGNVVVDRPPEAFMRLLVCLNT